MNQKAKATQTPRLGMFFFYLISFTDNSPAITCSEILWDILKLLCGASSTMECGSGNSGKAAVCLHSLQHASCRVNKFCIYYIISILPSNTYYLVMQHTEQICKPAERFDVPAYPDEVESSQFVAFPVITWKWDVWRIKNYHSRRECQLRCFIFICGNALEANCKAVFHFVIYQTLKWSAQSMWMIIRIINLKHMTNTPHRMCFCIGRCQVYRQFGLQIWIHAPPSSDFYFKAKQTF